VTVSVHAQEQEASQLAESRALDPRARPGGSSNRAALAAVLQQQRALGLAKAAGTADLVISGDGRVVENGGNDGFGGYSGGWGGPR